MDSTLFPPNSPAAVAAAANAVLGSLDETLWAAKRPDEIVEAAAALEQLRCHLAAVQAAALAEVEDRKIAKQNLAWSSTGDWYTHTAGTHPRTGRRTRAPRQAAGRRADRDP